MENFETREERNHHAGQWRQAETRCSIAADGARRDCAIWQTSRPSIGTMANPALSAMWAHERPHGGRADEHFLPAGPFAILPLKGTRCSPRLDGTHGETPNGLSAWDDFVFEAGTGTAFMATASAPCHVEGPRRTFPLWPPTLARPIRKSLALRLWATPPTASTRSPVRASISASAMRRRLPKWWSKRTVSASISVPLQPYERYQAWRPASIRCRWASPPTF